MNDTSFCLLYTSSVLFHAWLIGSPFQTVGYPSWVRCTVSLALFQGGRSALLNCSAVFGVMHVPDCRVVLDLGCVGLLTLVSLSFVFRFHSLQSACRGAYCFRSLLGFGPVSPCSAFPWCSPPWLGSLLLVTSFLVWLVLGPNLPLSLVRHGILGF